MEVCKHPFEKICEGVEGEAPPSSWTHLWIRMCVCSVLLAVKHFPQISQVNGFSPVDARLFLDVQTEPPAPGGRGLNRAPPLTCVSPQMLLQLGRVHEPALTLGTLW